MPAKNPPDPNEKPQKERFIEFARKQGADQDARAVDRILPDIAKLKKADKSKD